MSVALALAAAALTASGRLQLLPTELELRLLDKVDVEFPGGVGGDLAPKFVVCVRARGPAAHASCATDARSLRAAPRARTRAGCCASRRTAWCGWRRLAARSARAGWG
jgi:hypothetical protein